MFDVVVSVSLKYHSKRVRKKCLKCFYTMFLKPAQYLLSAWINLKWQFCWEDIPNCINIRTLSCMNIFNVSMVVSLSNCFFFEYVYTVLIPLTDNFEHDLKFQSHVNHSLNMWQFICSPKTLHVPNILYTFISIIIASIITDYIKWHALLV